MKIAHISDLHIANEGKIIWESDTLQNFNRLIEKLSEIKELDAIVITGDISDDATTWAYKYIDNAFKLLGVPTYCIPGNHDSLPVFYDQFRPKFYVTTPKAMIQDWKFLFLNSVICDSEDSSSNMSRGFIPADYLNAINQELEDGVQTCICLHHPPLEPGGWLNRKLLDNRTEFNYVLKKHPNVRCVLYGHIHYFTQTKVEHILYSSASSIGFAFDKKLPKFQIAKGKEGFSVIDLANTITVQQVFLLDG